MTLPPGEAGAVRGELRFSLTSISWEVPGQPARVNIQLSLPGADTPARQVSRQLTPGASTSALCEPFSFDIHCSEQAFATYLRDMQAVTIKISDAVKHTLVGAVTVPVEYATLRTVSLDALPVLSPDNQRCLGKLGLTVTRHIHG